MADAKAEKDVQKRLINQKQIRSLRNQYRGGGGLIGSQSGSSLGTDNQLPNKLGTA